MSDFWEEWAGLIVPVVTLIIVFACVALANYEVNLHTCVAKTAEIGFPAKYDMWSGCRIFVENRWIPLENWYFKTQ